MAMDYYPFSDVIYIVAQMLVFLPIKMGMCTLKNIINSVACFERRKLAC